MAGIVNQAYMPYKRSVRELLQLSDPAIVVPDWQRNYSWSNEHVETLWTDLVRFSDRCGETIKDEYFFGSVVLVVTNNNLLLLDGQQRLATSTILLSAIRNKVASLDDEIAAYIQNSFLSHTDPIEKKMVHKLRLNVYDRTFFQRLISEKREVGYLVPQPEMASHRLIAAALAFFEAAIDSRLEGKTDQESKEWLTRILGALCTNFTMIAAYSANEDSAAEVFETLNDRGIGLSTPDLLRNLVIRRALDNQQNEIVKYWESVIAFQSDVEIKAFLRHFWISKYGDVKSQSLYREMKNRILDENICSMALSIELNETANLYRRLKRADDDNEEVAEQLAVIGDLGSGASILYPSIISIFLALTADEVLTPLSALIHIFVRDGIIGSVENSVLENKFHKAARDLRNHRNAKTFCADIARGALNDDDVRHRFARLSLTQNGQRRYILRRIEIAKRATGELNVNSPSRVHVEHIYPQTPQVGARLNNHDRLINRIGNLTLLDKRINSAIRNAGFAAKKEHYGVSEILITRALCDFEDWSEERITARQEEFAQLVPAIWPVITV